MDRSATGGIVQLDKDGHLTRVAVVDGVPALIQVLRYWLDHTDHAPALTIGNLEQADRHTAIVTGHLEGESFVLHADTTQEAVRQVVAAGHSGWRVVANQRYNVNLVLPAGPFDRLRGWYCYLRDPRVRPGLL
jgi:hypothetical protein